MLRAASIPVSSIGTLAAASVPAASSVPVNTRVTIGDLRNSDWYSDGTYWRPAGGRQLIYSMAGDSDPITGGTGEVQIAVGGSGITATIPTIVMAPGMEIRQMHTLVKTGTAGTCTQRIRKTNIAGTNLAYSTALGATIIGAQAAMTLAAGSLSGGNITLTNVMTGTTSAEIGTSTASAISITQAITNPLVLFPTLQNASAADSVTVRSFKVWVHG